MTMKPVPERLFTTRELAARFGVHRSTVTRWLRQKRLSGEVRWHRFGKHGGWRVTESAVFGAARTGVRMMSPER